MLTHYEKIIQQLTNAVIEECRKKKTLHILKHKIFNPLVEHALCQLQPFIIGVGVMFGFMVIFMLTIIIVLFYFNIK
jgi:hypothetical protein